MPDIEFLQGDAREALKALPADSFDSLVTDPPAGIGMLNQEWDAPGIGVDARHAFTKFITDVAIQAYRVLRPGAYGFVWSLPRSAHWTGWGLEDAGFEIRDAFYHVFASGFPKNKNCLKPACEHWFLVRKPGELHTLQVDESRVQGRYPPNFGFTHLPECKETGTREVKGQKSRERPPDPKSKTGWGFKRQGGEMKYPTDEDGYETLPEFLCAPGCPVLALNEQVPNSDRFFYVGKPDQEERNMGCTDLYWKRTETGHEQVEFVEWSGLPADKRAQGNFHISVKPVSLMRQLTRLVTPPGGRVLDCFAGSGTTALACAHEGLRFLGVERETSYLTIATKRVAAIQERLAAGKRQLSLPFEPSEISMERSPLAKGDIKKLLARSARRR